MKIRVECRATVMVDVKVSLEQIRQLEAGTLKLDDVVDESVAYEALAADGDIEFCDWDVVTSKSRRSRK